jgi:ammonia channel protein AmtB
MQVQKHNSEMERNQTKTFAPAALVATAMLGPRLGRYDNGLDPMPLGSPTNALMGLFMLWWGWLAFNSGRYN